MSAPGLRQSFISAHGTGRSHDGRGQGRGEAAETGSGQNTSKEVRQEQSGYLMGMTGSKEQCAVPAPPVWDLSFADRRMLHEALWTHVAALKAFVFAR